jgi:hypothetical protein
MTVADVKASFISKFVGVTVALSALRESEVLGRGVEETIGESFLALGIPDGAQIELQWTSNKAD